MIDSVADIVRIAVLQEQITALKESIVLQAREYERRLSELNYAHQNQLDRNEQYVSRESWEIKNAANERAISERYALIDEWRRSIDKWMYISIGAGITGGGLMALVVRLLGANK